MRRVAREHVVFLTYEPPFRGVQLTDYFPTLITLDESQVPQIVSYEKWFWSVEVSLMPIQQVCLDGFLAGYWRRPAAYLNEPVRAAMSSYWKLGEISKGLEKLEAGLNRGEWDLGYSDLPDLKELGCGYRLIETK